MATHLPYEKYKQISRKPTKKYKSHVAPEEDKRRGKLNKYGKPIGKIKAHQICKGCGRLLPKGSWVEVWNIWSYGCRERYRICPDCQDIVYECQDGKLEQKYNNKEANVKGQDTLWLVKDACERCDEFPTCDKVDFIKNNKPGDWYFGGLET